MATDTNDGTITLPKGEYTELRKERDKYMGMWRDAERQCAILMQQRDAALKELGVGDWHPYGNPNASGAPGAKSANLRERLAAAEGERDLARHLQAIRERCVFCGENAWYSDDGIAQHPSFHACYARAALAEMGEGAPKEPVGRPCHPRCEFQFTGFHTPACHYLDWKVE